jgi:hypothetical protein
MNTGRLMEQLELFGLSILGRFCTFARREKEKRDAEAAALEARMVENQGYIGNIEDLMARIREKHNASRKG